MGMLNGAPITGLDLDGMPTGAAIKVLHATVSNQQAHLEALHGDISEIKTMLRSGITTAKLLIASVPVIAAIASGVIWALIHVKVSP